MSIGESTFSTDMLSNSSTIGRLTIGQTGLGEISGVGGASGDRDWYKVYLQANTGYVAVALGQNVTGSGALAGETLKIKNAAGSTLFTAGPAGSGVGTVFQVATAGFYYVEVGGATAADKGGYLVKLNRASTFGDDHGGDVPSGQADDASELTLGAITTGNLQVAGDTDSFMIDVKAGKRYFFTITSGVTDLSAALDTLSYQRIEYQTLGTSKQGAVISPATTTVMLSLTSDSFTKTGAYSFIVDQAISTDKALKLGSAAANTIVGTTAAEEIWGFDGNDNLQGAGGSDILVGGKGIDTLNGGAGGDRMIGNGGNDIYIIDSASDILVETETTGSTADVAKSSVSYTLGAGVRVETLRTTNDAGTGAINLTGNELGNTIVGNAGANVLKGGGGIDTIKGGAGNDKIFGGAANDILFGEGGKDQFRFDTAPNSTTNKDKIEDFVPVDDSIVLKKSIFAVATDPTKPAPTAAVPAPMLATAFKRIDGYDPNNPFAKPTDPDANDRIIYDQLNGKIFYDADGSGAIKAILFATVDPGTALTPADFLIIL